MTRRSPCYMSRQLDEELIAAGVPELVTPRLSAARGVYALVNGVPSEPYIDILLRYLNSSDDALIEPVVRALSQRPCRRAAGQILELFNRIPPLPENTLWVAGNALRVYNDPRTYPQALALAKNSSLGISRQMIMILVARMRTEEAFSTLLGLLDDLTVRGHVIDALAAFGDPRAIPHIEATGTTKGHYDGSARRRALKRLRKRADDLLHDRVRRRPPAPSTTSARLRPDPQRAPP